jgi:hypothetical protein
MKDCTCKIPIQVEDEKWVFGGREGFTTVGEERGKLNFHS